MLLSGNTKHAAKCPENPRRNRESNQTKTGVCDGEKSGVGVGGKKRGRALDSVPPGGGVCADSNTSEARPERAKKCAAKDHK